MVTPGSELESPHATFQKAQNKDCLLLKAFFLFFSPPRPQPFKEK